MTSDSACFRSIAILLLISAALLGPTQVSAQTLPATAPQSESAAVRHFIESAKAAQELTARLTTRFTVTTMKPWPLGSPPSVETLGKHPRDYELHMYDQRWHAREFIPAQPEFGSPAVVQDQTWDGHLWRSYGGHSGGLRIETRPPMGLFTDCWALFNNISLPSFIGRPLAESVQDMEASGMQIISEQEQGDAFTLRVSIGPGGTTRGELVFAKSTPLQLRQATIDLFKDPPENGGAPLIQVRYIVEDWQEYEGIILPRRARREATLYRREGDAPDAPAAMVGVSIFERQSAALRKPEHVDDVPFPEFVVRENESVRDESMALVFTVGQSYLTLDGTQFQTIAPVLRPPKSDLPAVMTDAQEASFQPPLPRRTSGFYAAETAVLLKPGIPQPIILTCLQPGDEPPPAPAISVPDGVDVLVQKWRVVYPQDEATKRPVRWQAEVVVTSHNEELPPRTSMQIELPDHKPIKIDLTGRPIY